MKRFLFGACVVLSVAILSTARAAEGTSEKAVSPPAEKAATEKLSKEGLVPISASSPVPLAWLPEKLSEEGFVPIFNGKDLTDWDGKPTMWSVKDGCLRGETTKENPQTGGNTFIIWRGGKPADFDLRMTCRLKGGNSGIQYRSTERPEKWVVGGYQMEVSMDAKNAGFLYGELARGSIAKVGEKVVYAKGGGKKVEGSLGNAAEIAKTFKVGDWNDYRIVAKGNHIAHYLNGVQTIDLIDEDPQWAKPSGIIALQIHQGDPMVVEFKNIRLKTFPKEGGETGKEEKKAAKP